MSIQKPSAPEDEYFALENAEKIRRMAVEQAGTLGQDDRETLRAQHYMHCPKCGLKLHEITRHGIVADRCFGCHGMFFDADDVAKLLGKEGYWEGMLSFFARTDYAPDETP